MKRPRPWSVLCSDFRRYIYRALAAVEHNHALVIYIHYQTPQTHRWKKYRLCSIRASQRHLSTAHQAFREGRARPVLLSKLPSLRKTKNPKLIVMPKISPTKKKRGQLLPLPTIGETLGQLEADYRCRGTKETKHLLKSASNARRLKLAVKHLSTTQALADWAEAALKKPKRKSMTPKQLAHIAKYMI